MFEISRFEPEDIISLIEQPMNESLAHWYTSGYAATLRESTLCFTGRVQGEVMICAGVAPLWKGRGYLWVVLSENIRAHSVTVYRGAKKWLKAQPYDRIEMDSPIGFELGARRAEWMGFTLEIPRARKYLPNGEDAAVYVWVRE